MAPGISHPFLALLRRDTYLLHRGARALAIMGANRSADAHFCRPCRPALPLHQARVLDKGRLTHREASVNHFHSMPGIDPSGTTVAQAELQLSAPDEQAGRRGPGTG